MEDDLIHEFGDHFKFDPERVQPTPPSEPGQPTPPPDADIGQPAPNAQPLKSFLSRCLVCGRFVIGFGVRFCAEHHALDDLDDEAFAKLADCAYAVHAGERSDWPPHAADGMPINHKRMMQTHPAELGLYRRPWQIDVGAFNRMAHQWLDDENDLGGWHTVLW